MENVKLGNKLLLLIASVAIIFIIVATFSSSYFLKQTYNQEVIHATKRRAHTIKTLLNEVAKKNVYSATVFADLDFVRTAYAEYNQNSSIDNAADMIELGVRPILSTIFNNSGSTPKVGYYLPPATLLFRSWDDNRGEDLSRFRNSIIEVNNKQSAISGMEIGQQGFVIRGIVPVFESEENNLLGAVEVSTNLPKVLNTINLYDNEQIAIYIDQNQAKKVTQLQKKSRVELSRQTIGDYVFLEESSEDFKTGNLNQRILDYASTSNFAYRTVGDYFYAAFPIKDYRGVTTGVIAMQFNQKELYSYISNLILILALCGLGGIILGVFIVRLMINKVISQPLEKILIISNTMVYGDLAEKIDYSSDNEIGMISHSINKVVDGLRNTAAFANEIGRGNLNVKFSPLGKRDMLGNALLTMQKSLRETARHEKKRVLEEEKQKWITEGIAKFGDILRQNNDNIETLTHEIIKNLVKYLNANQGGLFIRKEDKEEPYYDLLAAYAYNYQKYYKKQIKINEGLVGACAIEKETIYITEIPDDYIEIESGLGNANPSNLLLVPLRMDENVLGIVELASFNQFREYEIEFTERIAESVASTLSIASINSRTLELLEKSENLETELNSNAKQLQIARTELEAITETTSIKIAEANELLNAVTHSFIRADFDLKGNVIYANTHFLEVMEYTSKEIQGQHFGMFLLQRDQTELDIMWHNLVNGSNHFEEAVNHKTKFRTVWLLDTYTSVRNREGEIIKILYMAINITNLKKQQQDFHQRLLDLDSQRRKESEDSEQKNETCKTENEQLNRQLREMEGILQESKSRESEYLNRMKTIETEKFSLDARINELEKEIEKLTEEE